MLKLDKFFAILIFLPFICFAGKNMFNPVFLPQPNKFWPNNTTLPFYVPPSSFSANFNPEVFCDSLGNGYRLPAAGELYSGLINFKPNGTFFIGQVFGHYSNYIDNDINKPLKYIKNKSLLPQYYRPGLVDEWVADIYYPGYFTHVWVAEIGETRTNYPERYFFRAPDSNSQPGIAFIGNQSNLYITNHNQLIPNNIDAMCVREIN